MQSQIQMIARGTFGTLFVCALGLGATQALASPQRAATVPACTIQQCTLSCIQRGFAAGFCNPDAMCVCVGAP
jgi:hypothetical protein